MYSLAKYEVLKAVAAVPTIIVLTFAASTGCSRGAAGAGSSCPDQAVQRAGAYSQLCAAQTFAMLHLLKHASSFSPVFDKLA